jgi:hypothetical protein
MDGDHTVTAGNPVGKAGFFASLLGICGVAIVGPFGEAVSLAGFSMAFLTLPGILLSAIGLGHRPRRLAAWGLVIGIASAMYLPTFCLFLFRRP